MINPASLKKVWHDFKRFAMRGNFFEICIGLAIGSALTNIANSFITEIVMPPLGLLIGNTDFSDFYVKLLDGNTPGPYANFAAARAANAVVIRYGIVLNHIFSFIVQATVWFMIIKGIEKSPLDVAVESTRLCPYCKSKISVEAIKCGFCTSELS